MATNTASSSTTTTPKTEEHIVAQFIGHAGTERILTKADQDTLVGVKGVGKEDLVWPAGNRKLDVTDVHEDVVTYLRSDEEFKVSTVTVTPES